MSNKELWIVDNFDSFTYNIVHAFEALKQPVKLFRNHKITTQMISENTPKGIVIGPGPGSPANSGNSLSIIRQCIQTKLPLLGICLGHQCLAQLCGASIIEAPKIMHGKNSLVYHNNTSLFKDTPNPLSVTRYHSLIVDITSLPEILEPIALTKKKEIMGIKYKNAPAVGLQFHPEAICSHKGSLLLENFIKTFLN